MNENAQPPNVPDLSDPREVDFEAAAVWMGEQLSEHFHPLLARICQQTGGNQGMVCGLVGQLDNVEVLHVQ